MRNVAMVLKPQMSTYDVPSLLGMSKWSFKSAAMKLRKLWMKGVYTKGILFEKEKSRLLVEMMDKADLFRKCVVISIVIFSQYI